MLEDAGIELIEWFVDRQRHPVPTRPRRRAAPLVMFGLVIVPPPRVMCPLDEWARR